MNEYQLDLSKYGPLGNGTATKAVHDAASRAVRDGLALMERHHKQQEMRRGGGNSKPVAGRVTRRTGNLSRSYGRKFTKGSLSGEYGSDSKAARLLEFGGTIRPKRAKHLAIPTEHAKQGVGGGLGPRHYTDLFKPRGKDYLARRQGNSLQVMFHLVKSARIPSRPDLGRTVTKKTPEVTQMIAKACAEAL